MIDWWMVLANSLWILGLSTLLAAFGYHDWLAKETGRRRRNLFKEKSWQVPWTLGMFLTSAGWMLSQGHPWWEQAPWLGLTAWFGWKMASVLIPFRKGKGAGCRATSKEDEESDSG